MIQVNINASIWYDLMEDALKFPTKTYEELKEPYSFELNKITEDFVENIKEIIYDLRKDPTFNHFDAGLHMMAITGSQNSLLDFDMGGITGSLVIEVVAGGNIGLGCPDPDTELYIGSASLTFEDLGLSLEDF